MPRDRDKEVIESRLYKHGLPSRIFVFFRVAFSVYYLTFVFRDPRSVSANLLTSNGSFFSIFYPLSDEVTQNLRNRQISIEIITNMSDVFFARTAWNKSKIIPKDIQNY